MKDITPAGFPKASGIADLKDVRWDNAAGGKMHPHDNRSRKALALRLDRAFGEMNAFLLALAIGLAALDAAYSVGTKDVALLQHMPQLTHTTPGAAPAASDGFVASAR
jgi:hypothetical protein